MTIITAAPETAPNSYPTAIKSLIVNGATPDIIKHDDSSSPTSIVNEALSVSSDVPTSLLAKFVDAYKELQSYK